MDAPLDRWYTNEVEITDDHLKLARRLNVVWQADMEWGAVEFGDAKRPFGNGDMPGDVAEILGWETGPDRELTPEQATAAKRLHFEMGYVAKALLARGITALEGTGRTRRAEDREDRP